MLKKVDNSEVVNCKLIGLELNLTFKLELYCVLLLTCTNYGNRTRSYVLVLI